MIKINKSEWPVVHIEVDGILTLPDMEEYTREMDSLLDFADGKREKYGIIYMTELGDDQANMKREKEAKRLSTQWLKANRERIGEHCVGIAMVMPNAGKMVKMMRPIAKRSMKRMMGAPGDMFFEQELAETWIKEQL
ncbi:MAG: hypothetical protein AAF490_03455 [Chloroflexota bacterium]